jgi:post-segregation antitoxin (ccd killing protein)
VRRMKNNKQNSTWEHKEVPRGNNHNKTATKTTVSLYLNKKLVEKARNHRLNLSRITEQALSSILDYLEAQNSEMHSNGSSAFLNRRSFLKESRMPRAGFEPATTRSSAERSPRLSYLGNYLVYLVYFWESLFIYLSSRILVYPFGKRNQSLL